jgi:hypothetical protein
MTADWVCSRPGRGGKGREVFLEEGGHLGFDLFAEFADYAREGVALRNYHLNYKGGLLCTPGRGNIMKGGL